MQRTRALGSLKALFPPIHQPLPLDKREAQRLLDGIKASFRAQLDAEYGWTPSPPAQSRSLTKQAVAPSVAAFSAASRKHGAAPSTDRHMRAILRNPLFLPTESAPAANGDMSTLGAHKAIFEKAVSRGLMTVARAHGFLEVVLSEVNKSREGITKTPLATALKPVGAGRLVVQWLRSSGQERDLIFLANVPFQRRLVQFMAAEGLDDVFWAWIERLLSTAEQHERPLSRAAQQPLYRASFVIKDFINKKAQPDDLEPAYTAILKAEALAKEKELPLTFLEAAWRELLDKTVLYSNLPRCPPVQVHLFEAFMDLGRTMGFPLFGLAHLTLLHPVRPSADLALQLLSNEGWSQKLPGFGKRMIWRFKHLGIDTVGHLIHTNQPQEAARVWDVLRRYFPTGLHPEPQLLSGMGTSSA
jgi:hypothetical protein